ncbi:PREDICTED: nucleosome assembly protein 1-like 1-A isoform X2 [Priapulus caudatus]|uniref:Nucleosome assembly protein 1-like 1-A isoform X2 n=1 Tax=Priapulus caudatus TaxID=37621 RepID=A0ABM1ER15_PRICU|nr:PREDICTED: nucleosome assembly protein 1-like 1-A isoform X2 [Priapulus caudatus]
MADENPVDVEAAHEDMDAEEEVDATETAKLTSKALQDPQVLAALQERLGSMVGTPSGYIQSLPKVVKRRIKALKKLQAECTNIEAKFYEEVHALEVKYAALYSPLFEKRSKVVTGAVEPADEECDWPSEDEDELADDLKKKVAIEDSEEKKEDKVKEEKEEESPSGIPEFWLTILKNVEITSEMIQDHDEPILKHLQDVKVKFEDMGFTLEFYFTPNEFFTNSVLTKQYIMKCQPDPKSPFSFEGPEIIKCKGCKIDWKTGKNVTVKLIKKKQKHKSKSQTRFITKTVQNDSFFNFFSPPDVPEGEDAEVDEETEALLGADFEIGHFIRERIVPRAVLYFTGEALEDEEFEEEEGEEEGEEGEEEDDDNDPEFNPQANGQKPAECKQQ